MLTELGYENIGRIGRFTIPHFPEIANVLILPRLPSWKRAHARIAAKHIPPGEILVLENGRRSHRDWPGGKSGGCLI